MISNSLVRVSTLAVAFIAVGAPATEVLRHDLFARPLLTSLARTNRSGATSATELQAAWSPKLTAVVVAGADSVANIDGTIIRVGETIDGYRLLRVQEGAAVFTRNDQQVVLTMNTTTTAGARLQSGR
jgi:hypothetical protein